jgi:hypothetical protein
MKKVPKICMIYSVNVQLHRLDKKKWCEILDQPDLDWKKVYNLPFKVTKAQNYNGYRIESITIS